MLGSRPDSGILRTLSQWNVLSSCCEYAVMKWRCTGSRSIPSPSSRESISAESSGSILVDCHLLWMLLDCDDSDWEVDAEDVDSCCWSGEGASIGDRYENDDPVLAFERTDIGDVGDRTWCSVRYGLSLSRSRSEPYASGDD